jgi:MOSC domain-containing protein YiiM
MSASVSSIFVAARSGDPMQRRDRVRALAGRGLEGDRNLRAEPHAGRDSDVTLIEMEVLEALRDETGTDLTEGGSRRNVHTRGVALNELVGREFRVGEVVLRGQGLCEPCLSLAEACGDRGVIRGLVHRGGLRASIERGGTIAVGDPVLVGGPEQSGSRASFEAQSGSEASRTGLR